MMFCCEEDAEEALCSWEVVAGVGVAMLEPELDVDKIAAVVEVAGGNSRSCDDADTEVDEVDCVDGPEEDPVGTLDATKVEVAEGGNACVEVSEALVPNPIFKLEMYFLEHEKTQW